ncbi:hypothetical protein GJ654_18820 [Rhodoblastus acidophilus]|uniref:Mu-like prophage tail protein gpP n=1 Tax=Rhodoblastus acidophilus TaxID=1074 RepID=A0A6N8DRK0_RHOAC|nr:hypothetical protein [Rhodoblastus acidophilus]MCW2276382.1 prophage tail gpP-like protein [Rhodoblastus acidophilus]MTV33037.1 hypothetical protein [Rhodoblastus acidophilus]
MAIEQVSVALSSLRMTGWTSVSIDWDYEAAAQSFELKVTEPEWTQAWDPGAAVPFLDEELSIYAGGDLVVTGYIDTYEANISTDNHEVTISGRSKSGDAIKSHAVHKTGRIEKKKLVDAANELSKSTGLQVKFTSDLSLKPIPKIQLARDDTVFHAVEREARKQGAALVPQPDGTVKITRPKGDRHAGQLVEGFFPLKSGRVKFDRSGQHSHIHVRGQRALGVDEKSLRVEHIELDATIKRISRKIVHLEGDGDIKLAKKRGKHEVLRQAAKGKVWTPKVSSWRDSTGQLWTPGKLVACRAPRWHIDGDMAIKSVSFSQDLTDGTIADLTMVDPRALGGSKGKGDAGALGAGGDGKDLDE